MARWRRRRTPPRCRYVYIDTWAYCRLCVRVFHHLLCTDMHALTLYPSFNLHDRRWRRTGSARSCPGATRAPCRRATPSKLYILAYMHRQNKLPICFLTDITNPHPNRPHRRSYVKLQMTASLCSSAIGVLSTQSLLYAMGLGAGSVPLAAALNWIIKDGIGQIGGIVFARCVFF